MTVVINGTTGITTPDLNSSDITVTNIIDSTGIYLGGTTSSNKLEDYETGSWTPTCSQGTLGQNYARYVKVGSLVTLSANLYTFSDRSSSSPLEIEGLPFVSASNAIAIGTTLSRYVNVGTGGDPVAYTAVGNSSVTFYVMSKGSIYTNVQHSHLSSASSNIYFTISYETAS